MKVDEARLNQKKFLSGLGGFFLFALKAAHKGFSSLRFSCLRFGFSV